jgi:hypothetical protein
MHTEIKSREQFYNAFKKEFWSFYNILTIDFQFSENTKDLEVSLSFYDGYGLSFKAEHKLNHIVLTLINIHDFEVNFVERPKLEEFITHLVSIKDQLTHIAIDSSFKEFNLSFEFGNKQDVRFLKTDFNCEKVLFERKKSTSIPVKKVLSKDVITVELKNELIPTAAKIKAFFKENSIKIYFTEYWGDELSTRVIKKNLNGVYLKDTQNLKSTGIAMSIEQTNEFSLWRLSNISDYVAMWDLLTNVFISKIKYERIICGNVIFTKKQWEDEEYKSGFKQMLTYES